MERTLFDTYQFISHAKFLQYCQSFYISYALCQHLCYILLFYFTSHALRDRFKQKSIIILSKNSILDRIIIIIIIILFQTASNKHSCDIYTTLAKQLYKSVDTIRMKAIFPIVFDSIWLLLTVRSLSIRYEYMHL